MRVRFEFQAASFEVLLSRDMYSIGCPRRWLGPVDRAIDDARRQCVRMVKLLQPAQYAEADPVLRQRLFGEHDLQAAHRALPRAAEIAGMDGVQRQMAVVLLCVIVGEAAVLPEHEIAEVGIGQQMRSRRRLRLVAKFRVISGGIIGRWLEGAGCGGEDKN